LAGSELNSETGRKNYNDWVQKYIFRLTPVQHKGVYKPGGCVLLYPRVLSIAIACEKSYRLEDVVLQASCLFCLPFVDARSRME
jgi:hypothetical protein